MQAEIPRKNQWNKTNNNVIKNMETLKKTPSATLEHLQSPAYDIQVQLDAARDAYNLCMQFEDLCWPNQSCAFLTQKYKEKIERLTEEQLLLAN